MHERMASAVGMQGMDRWIDPSLLAFTCPGPCKLELEHNCEFVEQGEGRLAECISDEIVGIETNERE